MGRPCSDFSALLAAPDYVTPLSIFPSEHTCLVDGDGLRVMLCNIGTIVGKNTLKRYEWFE